MPDKLSSANRISLPYPSTPIKFDTFPNPHLPGGTHFRFIVSSCVTPNFPYIPLQGRRIKGFELLARYLFQTSQARELGSPSNLSPQHRPELPLGESVSAESPVNTLQTATSAAPAKFLLFLGDFIYADVPTYIGDDKEAYRRLYRRNYQSNFREIYEQLVSCQHPYVQIR
jgi:alkaline phosphatase D